MNYDNANYPTATGTLNNYVKAVRRGVLLVCCRVCGQCHSKNNTHLYDYEGTVDDDLICHICFQPFVNPIDCNCGCTFCSVCLQNHLKRYKTCPVDNIKIELKFCHKASPALKKILDKLLVVCPNNDYCEEILPRNLLENHLLNRCKGSITYCIHAHLGCDFQGPRSALISHLQECSFNESSEDLYKEPIIAGKLCQIELHRGYSDLGLYIVGGADTPIGATVIQSIKSGSAAERDGRLQPGDHILKLNGCDLTLNTHSEVIELFSEAIPICSMVVYRDSLNDSSEFNYEYREEIIKVNLEKKKGQFVGIKIGNKKKEKGIWILNILKGSLAEADGRLKINDRILEINCQNVKNGTKEEAQKIIAASSTLVSLVVSREIEPNVPMGTLTHARYKNINYGTNSLSNINNLNWQEYTLSLIKNLDEPLGIFVDGGVSSFDKDNTPIYVTSIESHTWIEKSKHIKKGDILIKIDDEPLIGLSKEAAASILEKSSRREIVKIDYIRSQDLDDDNQFFKPSWRYFITIPIIYQIAKNVVICKDQNEYLGLTIAGGRDVSSSGSITSSFDRIFIKSVIPNSSAARSKKLKSGDIILTVNDVSLQNISHTDAIRYLKAACGMIKFVIISCPGTLI